MKTILRTSLFFVLIIFFNSYAQNNGQWEILNEGGSYRTIDFINDQVGWIAGAGTLLKTEDGGETWNFVSMDSAWNIVEIDFVNETVGWAETNSYQIIKTVDGGYTWFIQKELNINNEDDMEMVLHAVNDTILYASVWDNGSDSFRIIRTVDGGTNWMDISQVDNGRSINSIWFQDCKRGIFLGCTTSKYNNDSWYEPYNGIILKTNDVGETWDETIVPEFTMMSDLQFINDSTAYFLATRIYGDKTEYFLCITTDTLNSWSIIYQDTRSIDSFYCLDDRTIFATMTDNTGTKNLMKSSDGGFTWDKKQTNLRITYGEDKIYFKNADVGFFVGEEIGNRFQRWRLSFFSKSIDGGEHWIIQKMYYPSLNDVYFFDKNSGIISGGWDTSSHGGPYDGDLFFTNDGGKTWEWGSFGDGEVNSCFFINASTGFISFQKWWSDSNVYKTRDAGKNWTKVYENNYDSAGYNFSGNDINFINDEIGWVTGEYLSDNYMAPNDTASGAALLGTIDGGENWDLVWKYPNIRIDGYVEYPYQLNSIKAIGEEAWAVGESGMIVKYTEQDQWQVQSSITDLPLNKVYFYDQQHGWIAGGYYNEDNVYLKLFRTIDGGEHWQDIPNINYQINDIFFEDSLHGWAVGNDTTGGMILETEDGGNNWTVQAEELISALNAIHFKDGYGWAVGGNGLVLRTENGINWVDQNSGKTYPNKFSLSQNYPNPFNPSTKIKFALPKADKVKIELYNNLGQRVEILRNQHMKAGQHEVEFNAQNLSSGIYFYRIEVGDPARRTGEFQDVKKMVLLR